MRRRYGIPIPVEVAFDEYTIDTTENRLLLDVVERLTQLPYVPCDIRGRLQRLRARLDGVGSLRREASLPGGRSPGSTDLTCLPCDWPS